MIYLQCMNEFNKVAQLNPLSGKVVFFSKNKQPDEANQPKIGTFACVDDKIICFYRYNNELNIKINKDHFILSDSISSKWHIKEGATKSSLIAIFSILDNNKVLFNWEYSPFTSRKPLIGDDTSFIDEEDYDFCLFIHNVLCSKERRKGIYDKPFSI